MIRSFLTFSFLVVFILFSCTDKKTTSSEDINSDSIPLGIEAPNEGID